MTSPTGNFGFLVQHAPLLAELGATAERLFPFDPASCVLKLRLLAEAITQDIAARLGVHLIQPTQAELLRAVDARLGIGARQGSCRLTHAAIC
jgi:type I restriction enzyme R subunit